MILTVYLCTIPLIVVILILIRRAGIDNLVHHMGGAIGVFLVLCLWPLVLGFSVVYGIMMALYVAISYILEGDDVDGME